MTADQLIHALALTDENIFAEAAGQASLFMQAARYRVEKMRERNQSQLALDSYKAKLALHIRAKKDAEGHKITEGHLQQKAECSKRVRQLRQEFEASMQREELSKLILEGMRMRRDAIRIIAEARMYEGRDESHEVEQAMRRHIVKQARKLNSRRHDSED